LFVIICKINITIKEIDWLKSNIIAEKILVNIGIYETSLLIENSIIHYIFESSGQKRIIKAVQYSRLKSKSGDIVYNLSFGDYNSESKSISDIENSNNGDMRNIFNTVLSTIPIFFKEFPEFPIFIQGSDSHDSFEEKCREECFKNCRKFCKNKNRRIRTYSHFLDKNFKEFSEDYIFYGLPAEGKAFVDYVPKNKYTAILIYKKKSIIL